MFSALFFDSKRKFIRGFAVIVVLKVPFGKAAFFPGRLVHTNEFLVMYCTLL